MSRQKSDRICPWWVAYTFDHPGRRMFHRPEKILAPYVRAGMTVLDIGCGMGFFALGMARLVGESGLVIAADVQEKMLAVLQKRARKAGVAARIRPHLCPPDRFALQEQIDFALAFWAVHELPDRAAFFREVRALLKPGANLLLVEPKRHIGVDLRFLDEPKIALSHAALFTKD